MWIDETMKWLALDALLLELEGEITIDRSEHNDEQRETAGRN